MKNIITFSKVPILTDGELEDQTNEHLKLLELIHPIVKEDCYKNERVEIRAIKRGISEDKDSVKIYNHFYNDTKGSEYYKRFLKEINGENYCQYYAVFLVDIEKSYKNGQGFKQKGYHAVNNANAAYTMILVMDFDNVTYEEYQIEKQKFKELGIETISIFSGHGYQDIILLNEKVYDKEILDKFTSLLLKKGFKVDPQIGSAAQIMRLPDTFNCKAFDPKSKYYDSNKPRAILTELIEITEVRYNVDDVFDKLESLEDVEDYSEYNSIRKDVRLSEKYSARDFKLQKADFNYDLEKLNEEYPNGINLLELPIPICNALYRTPEGMRNSMLYFLTVYFKIIHNMYLSQVRDVMIIWNERSKPPQDNKFIVDEVNRLYRYNGLKGHWTHEMSKYFGRLDLECYNPKNKVIFNNVIFREYQSISPAAIKLFSYMLLDEKLLGKTEWLIKELFDYVKMSEKTIRLALKDLIRYGYITKVRYRDLDSLGYSYKLNRIKLKQNGFGFTSIDYDLLERIVNDKTFTNMELKLYLYLLSMKNRETETCYPSNIYLADKVGYNEKSIHRLTSALHNKGLIVKETNRSNGLYKCTYRLEFQKVHSLLNN